MKRKFLTHQPLLLVATIQILKMARLLTTLVTDMKPDVFEGGVGSVAVARGSITTNVKSFVPESPLKVERHVRKLKAMGGVAGGALPPCAWPPVALPPCAWPSVAGPCCTMLALLMPTIVR